jgi:hypothetical protein
VGDEELEQEEKRVGCENCFWLVPDVDGRSELSNGGNCQRREARRSIMDREEYR